MSELDTELGAHPSQDGTHFAVFSATAETIELCLFDQTNGDEIARHKMVQGPDSIFRLYVEGVLEGAHYGYRAQGPFAPEQGLLFDPSKLLLDPYASEINHAFHHHEELLTFGAETAHLVPKAIVRGHQPVDHSPVQVKKAGFVYELSVKAFTMLHPEIPETQRGTISALAHPSIIAHLKRIGVDAVELLPIAAWIDERHLAALNLSNSWGYNPVGLMCIDPRLAPGGVEELRDTVAALHAEGIGVILDLVFNHSGESDIEGSTLSMRGLDNLTYYRHTTDEPKRLVNDTGTGNTIACDNPIVKDLIVESLRHFVANAGVDGFRFDLATVLGRDRNGFHRNSKTLHAIINDPILKDRILIAEPWDIGPGGYQLGNFPPEFLEWNDRARDDIRRFWRGDEHMTGRFAEAICGSQGIFSAHDQTQTRSVNFIAAHDGLSLYDLTAYEQKHNHANGEDNRDGHGDNHSWNNGTEGESDDEHINTSRRKDVEALLSTLFLSRGAIMLTAGDEGGRTQHGNNNAYCQDNEKFWLNWTALDENVIEHTAQLSAIRKRYEIFNERDFLTNENTKWHRLDGKVMQVCDWEQARTTGLTMVLKSYDLYSKISVEFAIAFNPLRQEVSLTLPGESWTAIYGNKQNHNQISARSVWIFQRPDNNQ